MSDLLVSAIDHAAIVKTGGFMKNMFALSF